MEAISDEQARLVRRLESIAPLSDADRRTLNALPMRVRKFSAHRDMIREGSRPTECCLVLDGFAFRYKLVGTGKRQILSFHPPGDIPDLQGLHLEVMDHTLAALGPVRAAFIAHDEVHKVIRRSPSIAAALWKATLVDAAIFRQWMVGLGRLNAYQRVAHLVCELTVRLRAVGLGTEQDVSLPLTQSELADAAGLSSVHVNRTLRELRSDGLMVMRGGSVLILDWEGLKRAADFDPSYLHQR